MPQTTVRSKRIHVIELDHSAYTDDIVEEIEAALAEHGLPNKDLLFRAYEAEEVINVHKNGTDRHDPSYNGEYSGLSYVDPAIRKELGLTEVDTLFAYRKDESDELHDDISKLDRPAISVYDARQLGSAEASHVFYFKRPNRNNRKKDAVIAVFRVNIY